MFKRISSAVLLFAMAYAFGASGGQISGSAPPRITDLFSGEEAKKAGLSKLSPDEITALNAAIFRVMIQIVSKSTSDSPDAKGREYETGDVDFFDSRGRAVAYISEDSDQTIYLWAGKPVAYLDEDSVFGFNGKHLGWVKGGVIYDHDGDVVAAIADKFTRPVGAAPLKGLRELRPLKGLKELKPLKPLFSVSWSETPAREFFLEGAE